MVFLFGLFLINSQVIIGSAMLQFWESAMAAHHNAPDICMEGHSVSKCYKDQSRNQRYEVLLRRKEKSPFITFGKRLLHCNSGNLRWRSKRRKFHRTPADVRGEFDSLGTCSSGQCRVSEEETFQSQSQRCALPRLRSSSMTGSHVPSNSAGDVRVASSSGGQFSLPGG